MAFAERLLSILPADTSGLRTYLLHEEVVSRLAGLATLLGRLDDALAAHSAAREHVMALSDAAEAAFEKLPIEEVEHSLAQALATREGLDDCLQYLRVRLEAVRLGALPFLEAHGTRPLRRLAEVYRAAFWQTLARCAFEQHPALRECSGMNQEALRRRFSTTDSEVQLLNQRDIAALLCRVPLPHGRDDGPRSTWTDLALIRHQVQLQRPRIAIRDLVRRARAAIQALKPCWMMSPTSVAQFLEAGAVEFDIVVIDEASQMRPEEAIGAMARGHQVVVVGDPMQLPPTTFFDRIDGFENEEDDELEAASVLDQALDAFQPYRNLRWHYRSRHEGLIRFSNHHFYGEKLITFPSPTDHGNTLGVYYHHVPGVYRGGGGNPAEVKAVADAAIISMGLHPDLSLGVVAMNREQSELLRLEIDRLLLRNPEAQEYVSRWEPTLWPFFVKNLENVQGDERDAIIISTVYGPNEQGRVMQRFGPINRADGHRRLNVLFTRARRRVDLFSSLTATQVVEGPGTSRGVGVLKAYLEYAATGRLSTGTRSSREPDSDFEVMVADALRSRGFEVVAQVGVAGFFIDIGVSHPSYPHGYLAGIECDGAAYHSSRSARDRDILRQEVLEGLGWRLYRVWSTDWFGNRSRETDRLLRFLDGLQNHDGQ